jgi:beta-lactamase class A
MRILAFICLIFCSAIQEQNESLRLQITQLSKAAEGTVGVSIENLETGDTLSYNGNNHAPMQSVFKFPIALAVLNRVDKGALSLEQKIHITKRELSDSETMSPLRDKIPCRDTDITINELLHFMVSQSDNIACDILLEKAGGPKQVEIYIHSLGVKGIAIAATEKQMHADYKLQYKSWCEPKEMTHLLKIFYEGKCLSKSSTAYLIKLMEETPTGAKRLKGLLPQGTIVAHKTGSSSTKHGTAAATNDVGVITLPNGYHLIISVFVTDSKASDTARDGVIALIAKAAYNNMGNK